MTLKIGNDIYEIESADNSIYFNSEGDSNRLTVTLKDSSINIENFSNLKDNTQPIILTTEETETTFNNYKLETVRKNYGNNIIRINLDFIKTN